MKHLLKSAREQKGLTVRQIALSLNIDQALISKFESGKRLPTRDQITKLAEILEIDHENLLTAWLKERILAVSGSDQTGIKALQLALESLSPQEAKHSLDLENLLADLDALKAKIGGKR